jgi:hypothetical protein
MRKRVSSIVLLSAVCATLGAAVFAVGAQAAVRHFDAIVISKDSASKTVLARTESGAKVSFKVNARTKFERIGGGFAGLTKGLAVEIDATNAGGQWVATLIEPRSGGGGDNSGGGGHDDGPNHT